MTIQQLEYIIAVDNYRHFAKAAEACYVTQPTLSMMIQKLEDELDVKIFDRSAHPVEPTNTGKKILEQARVSLRHFYQIKEVVDNEKNILTGDFKLGIIPTIAAYIVPELLRCMSETTTGINLNLQETPTAEIVESLLNGKLDGGLAATPLNHPMLVEIPIYYEKFYAYVSPIEGLFENEEVDLSEVDINAVWLLENIHCLRGQIVKLCQMKREQDKAKTTKIKYESGSMDTLINIVDYNGGLTIIPEMTAMGLPEDKQGNLRRLKGDMAVREVSLIVSQDFVRQKMANEIVEMIKKSVPKSMQDTNLKQYIVDVSY
jgi:LysR family hydrogen peroxide-inducible transcriptional activator